MSKVHTNLSYDCVVYEQLIHPRDRTTKSDCKMWNLDCLTEEIPVHDKVPYRLGIL